MPTPVELKCYKCKYFIDIEMVSEKDGLFKYLCMAYPEGIPEDIRCWEAENPSVKPRPHTSVQKDQVGEFVFEAKPIPEEIDITVDNILDYQIYDVNGFVGVLAITSDLKQFREFVFKLDGSIALKELFETGASLITQELIDNISIIKSDNRAIQKIIIILQKAVDKADTMVIISDGE